MLRRFAIISLAFIVLFSSIGANVYELFCACENLHQVSLFAQHHHCKKDEKTAIQKDRKAQKLAQPCCVKKQLSDQFKNGFKKRGCCDFKAKYGNINPQFHVFNGKFSKKLALNAKKQTATTPFKFNKKAAKNVLLKNKAALAAFSERPALAVQRLGNDLHVKKRPGFPAQGKPYGRLMRVCLASFLC